MPGVKDPILREAAISEGGCWRFLNHDDTTGATQKNRCARRVVVVPLLFAVVA